MTINDRGVIMIEIYTLIYFTKRRPATDAFFII